MASKLKQLNQRLVMQAAKKKSEDDVADDPNFSMENGKLPTKLREFDGSKVSYASRNKLTGLVLKHMISRADERGTQKGIMLTGDPGIGKTSFLRTFASMMGMELVLMEVPHLADEHIINIPVVQALPEGKIVRQTVKGEIKNEERQVNLILAQSNLYAKLKRPYVLPTDKYLALLNNKSKAHMAHARTMFKAMGGKLTSLGDPVNEIPEDIAHLRSVFSKILFLDEYYRQTTEQIRNSLRGLVENNLGLSKLPRHVYPIFASNMKDEGLDSSPKNEFVAPVEMQVSTPDEWFGYLTTEFEANKRPLKKEVVDMMYTILYANPSWLSYEDRNKDIRISPRRWEQIMVYINQSLPPPTHDVARNLMTNISLNFFNPKTGEKVDAVHDLVMQAVSRLINESIPDNCIPVEKWNAMSFKDKLGKYQCYQTTEKDRVPKTEWEETFRHQLIRKLSLGPARKHMPTLAGQPGVGKTHIIKAMALHYKLSCIYINCANLSYEDVTGTPLPATDPDALDAVGGDRSELKDGDVHVYFAESKLCKLIYKGAEENPPHPDTKDKKAYRYLIFLDEFNRVQDVRTFNALRKLVLEERFDNGQGLPEYSLLVAAVNLDDGGNIQELTSHMKDVMDIIPCLPSWDRQVEYMKRIKPEDIPRKADAFGSAGLPIRFPEIMPQLLEVIKAVNLAHMDETFDGEGDPRFQVRIGDNSIYFSPREYTDLYLFSIRSLDTDIKNFLREKGLTSIQPLLDEPDVLLNELDPILRESFFEIYKSSLSNAILADGRVKPHSLEPYFNGVKDWCMSPHNISFVKPLIELKFDAKDPVSIVGALLSKKEPFLESTEMVKMLTTGDKDTENNLKRILEDCLLNKNAFTDFSYPYRVFDEDAQDVVENGKFKLNSMLYVVNELQTIIQGKGLGAGATSILHKAIDSVLYATDAKTLEAIEAMPLTLRQPFKSEAEFEKFIDKWSDFLTIPRDKEERESYNPEEAQAEFREDALKLYREELERDKKGEDNKVFRAKAILAFMRLLMNGCCDVRALLRPTDGLRPMNIYAMLDNFVVQEKGKGGKPEYSVLPPLIPPTKKAA